MAVAIGALAASLPFKWIHRRRASAAAFALRGFLFLLGYASFTVALSLVLWEKVFDRTSPFDLPATWREGLTAAVAFFPVAFFGFLLVGQVLVLGSVVYIDAFGAAKAREPEAAR